MKKRIKMFKSKKLSISLSAIMAAAIMPSAVLLTSAKQATSKNAQERKSKEKDKPSNTAIPESALDFVETEDGYVLNGVIKGFSTEGYDTLDVPSSHGGKNVIRIHDDAFKNNSNIVTVNIPTSVKEVGSHAFTYCKNLTTVTYSHSGEGDQTLNINDSAFDSCSKLQSIPMPNGLKYIGSNAFRACAELTSFTSVDNPQIEYIGDGAFRDCSKFVGVEIDGEKKLIIPPSVAYIGSNAFQNCISIEIVEWNNTNLSYVPSYCFYNCSSLTDIQFPESSSIDTISSYAFAKTALAQINLSNLTSLANIKDNAFRGCSYATTITVDATNIASIGNGVFADCYLVHEMNFNNLSSYPEWASSVKVFSNVGTRYSSSKFVNTGSSEASQAIQDMMLASGFYNTNDWTFTPEIDATAHVEQIGGQVSRVYITKNGKTVLKYKFIDGQTYKETDIIDVDIVDEYNQPVFQESLPTTTIYNEGDDQILELTFDKLSDYDSKENLTLVLHSSAYGWTQKISKFDMTTFYKYDDEFNTNTTNIELPIGGTTTIEFYSAFSSDHLDRSSLNVSIKDNNGEFAIQNITFEGTNLTVDLKNNSAYGSRFVTFVFDYQYEGYSLHVEVPIILTAFSDESQTNTLLDSNSKYIWTDAAAKAGTISSSKNEITIWKKQPTTWPAATSEVALVLKNVTYSDENLSDFSIICSDVGDSNITLQPSWKQKADATGGTITYDLTISHYVDGGTKWTDEYKHMIIRTDDLHTRFDRVGTSVNTTTLIKGDTFETYLDPIGSIASVDDVSCAFYDKDNEPLSISSWWTRDEETGRVTIHSECNARTEGLLEDCWMHVSAIVDGEKISQDFYGINIQISGQNQYVDHWGSKLNCGCNNIDVPINIDVYNDSLDIDTISISIANFSTNNTNFANPKLSKSVITPISAGDQFIVNFQAENIAETEALNQSGNISFDLLFTGTKDGTEVFSNARLSFTLEVTAATFTFNETEVSGSPGDGVKITMNKEDWAEITGATAYVVDGEGKTYYCDPEGRNQGRAQVEFRGPKIPSEGDVIDLWFDIVDDFNDLSQNTYIHLIMSGYDNNGQKKQVDFTAPMSFIITASTDFTHNSECDDATKTITSNAAESEQSWTFNIPYSYLGQTIYYQFSPINSHLAPENGRMDDSIRELYVNDTTADLSCAFQNHSGNTGEFQFDVIFTNSERETIGTVSGLSLKIDKAEENPDVVLFDECWGGLVGEPITISMVPSSGCSVDFTSAPIVGKIDNGKFVANEDIEFIEWSTDETGRVYLTFNVKKELFIGQLAVQANTTNSSGVTTTSLIKNNDGFVSELEVYYSQGELSFNNYVTNITNSESIKNRMFLRDYLEAGKAIIKPTTIQSHGIEISEQAIEVASLTESWGFDFDIPLTKVEQIETDEISYITYSITIEVYDSEDQLVSKQTYSDLTYSVHWGNSISTPSIIEASTSENVLVSTKINTASYLWDSYGNFDANVLYDEEAADSTGCCWKDGNGNIVDSNVSSITGQYEEGVTDYGNLLLVFDFGNEITKPTAESKWTNWSLHIKQWAYDLSLKRLHKTMVDMLFTGLTIGPSK